MAGNQYQPDPRQSEFLNNYLNPTNDNFSNAYDSALAAGYTEEYAKNILNLYPKWLSESISDTYLRNEVQNNIRKAVTGEHEEIVKEFGKNVKWEATVLGAKGLLKDKYSERSEHTGPNGGPIQYEDLSQLSDEELANITKEGESGDGETGAI